MPCCQPKEPLPGKYKKAAHPTDAVPEAIRHVAQDGGEDHRNNVHGIRDPCLLLGISENSNDLTTIGSKDGDGA